MRAGPCEAIDNFFGVDLGACGQPGKRVSRACQHEHVRDGYLCEDHAANVAYGMCEDCHTHPTHPHECSIHIMPLTDTA